ncbi:DUF4097 family beta strand repeat-containing protein [Paenibacillus sp. HGF5]|uniref:DUF4097 family beta strand repeat-containing protein n=1 Tax=Paenibacillus sp. HGF5 TaxID=908341 RepID=UPI0002072C46|nr:DUF4097 family beta strand repeat-containing protein [Paenibacillus sp. HGF5]EGG32114.1 conserved domain protein [Paenibacillus sp. HGF5]
MKKRTGYLIVAVGVLLLIFTMNPRNIFSDIQFGFSFDTKKINEEQTLDANDYRDLTVKTGSINIHVVPGATDQITARLNGKVSSKYADQVKLQVEPNGDSLTLGVEEDHGINLGISIMDLQLTVELPEKQWAAAQIESGSGEIEVENMLGDTVTVKAGSGNVNVQQVNAGELTVHTGSGNIEVEEVEAKSVALQSGSGEISADGYHAEQLSFQNGSGNVELSDGEAALQGKTGSGNIRVDADRLIHNADLRAGSGNVSIDLDEEPSSLEVDFQGSSGEGKIEWDGMRYEVKDEDKGRLKGTLGSGEVLLKVRTGSGNFRLE